MKTWVWLVIGGITLGLFLMYYPTHSQLPSTRPAKTKPIRPSSITTTTITPVSKQLLIQNCTCDRDGILTGLGCPKIGQPCTELYYKPAHIHTKCPTGTMLMEGGQCVKEWDVQRRYPDISAV